MTRVQAFANRTAVNQAWVDMLRADCIVLTQSPRFANAISVTKAFPHGRETERDAVIELAQRMAEEYGLLVRIEVEGYFLNLRFARKESVARASVKPAEEAPRASTASRIRALFAGRRAAKEGVESAKSEVTS
jgi:hypothetical protein